MDDVLTRHWGWVALRGAAALLLGVLTLFYPAVTITLLVLFFGAFALADGIFRVISALAKRRGEEHWIAMLLGGVVGIIAGAVTFFVPGLTAAALVLLVALWAIVAGAAEIGAAIRLRKVIEGEWLLAASGILSVVFGALMLVVPAVGALAVALWLGVYATLIGGLLVVLSLRLRRWHRGHGTVLS